MSSEIGRNPKEYLALKVKDGYISAPDSKLILKFIADRTTTANIMPHTAASYARYLTQAMHLIGKPVKDWDYSTFADFTEQVKNTYQANTYRKHIGSMKLFVLFLIESGVITSIKPEQINRVGLPKPNRMTKVASDMLTVDEVMAIIKGAKNTRDRAIIAILFESGCRPFELLDMVWGDVNFDKYGATLNTAGKTGNPRRIRIINMAPHLLAWKNDYPGEASGESPVFVNLDSENHHAMTRGALKKILAKAVRNSGVTRRVHPYLFRHSRVTDMLAQGIPTSVIGLQFWGSLDSQMLKTYGHLSDPQTDAILLSHAGLTNGEPQKVSEAKPAKCPACGKDNAAGLTYCGACGATLDPVKYAESLKENKGVDELRAMVAKQQESIDRLLKILDMHQKDTPFDVVAVGTKPLK